MKKPCPFCGSDDIGTIDDDSVFCWDCGGGAAEKTWERRVDSALRAENEKLKERVGELERELWRYKDVLGHR